MTDSYVTSEQFEKFRHEESRHHQLDEQTAAERGRRLDSIDNKLDSIGRWRTTIQAEQEKIHKFLYGNGDPGIDEVLRRLVEFVERQEKKEETNWSDTKKFVLAVLAFVVNTILAIWIAKLMTP